MIEQSRYNHICRNNNGDGYLLYNFMSGALIELDDSYKDKVISLNGLEPKEITFLINNGILIDGFDEVDYLRFGNKLNCADKDLLSVLIAPTMECNFDCPYCFEHHGSGRMNIETQKAIVKYIEKSIVENNHKHLFVYWFGGEPLLCVDIIKSMSEEIRRIVRSTGVTYTSAMSTNGYFLTNDVARVLEEAGLNRIQVTVDGMKEINDLTRRLVTGEGTFDVIVRNLYSLKTSIKIHIRTNLNKNNVDEVPELEALINDIKERNGLDISLYGAHMTSYEYNNADVDSIELSMTEYSNTLKKNNMIGINKNSNLRFAFCDAAKVYSLCFDDKGNMYKCWNDIGNTKYAYDNIKSALDNGINLTKKNALDYLAHSFPEECVNCKLLPVCMGGCPKKRVVEGKKVCSPIKFNMDDYVNKKYAIAKGGVINETGN